MTKMSVVLPTYNEADNIKLMLPALKKVLEDITGKRYEIIIVDDNSPDNTATVAKETARSIGIDNNLKVIVREGKRGLATAVIDGFKASSGDYLVVMDADLQHPPEKIKEIYLELEKGADIVVASRFIKGGRDEGLSFARKIFSKGAALIGKLLVPQIRVLSDPMSGFFALRRTVIEGRLDLMNPIGFKILLEIMVKGKYSKDKVREVPIVFGKRAYGESKLGLKEILDYLLHILSLNEYRILKFMTVGVSGIFVNEGVLWLAHYKVALPVYLSGLLAIETSILSNFALNSLVTFRKERAKGTVLTRLAKYHVATAIGAFINYATLLLLTHLLGLNPLVANLIGILLGFLANYTLSEHYVWERVGRYE
jgi:dolichol-phosphate mannosyltransferase